MWESLAEERTVHTHKDRISIKNRHITRPFKLLIMSLNSEL